MTQVSQTPLGWEGRDCAEIQDPDRMSPFLMSVVSASNAWMFLSSRGALTAGRRSPSGALFPYTTDDKLHDSASTTGPILRVRVRTEGGDWILWRPFDERGRESFKVSRRIVKTIAGEAVCFEEINHDLGLTVATSWEASEIYGWIRRVEIRRAEGVGAAELEVLDGLRNLMPADADLAMQSQVSTLLDAYRMAELVPGVDLGLIRLSSIPIDQPRPNESLRASTVFCIGLPGATLLTVSQVGAFERGEGVTREASARGQRAAFLRVGRMSLAAGESKNWLMAADVEKDGAEVIELVRSLEDPEALVRAITEDLAQGRINLLSLVASSDGLQRTGSPAEDGRHYANTLFNIMRGGVFLRAGRFDAAEFARHVARVAPAVAENESALLSTLEGEIDRDRLLAALGGKASDDLIRLGREYLPLTFGRRHGDPSRPWNTFTIPGRGESGERTLHYEGNWRDIFQNWEALSLSFPGYADACVIRFLNASTADGYNPYRIDMSGVDWEVDDPHDPWAFIGYWGDHQVVYLMRLAQMVERFSPGGLGRRLSEGGYVFVDVPYRIAGFDAILEDPHSTIRFDDDRAALIDQRVESMGNEGRLLMGPDREPVRTSLGEKLLTPLMVKLTNLVPGGGIWMNTQRPEWNDANNAIAGIGLSVVTTAYLHAALETWTGMFERAEGPISMTPPAAELLENLIDLLSIDPPAPDMAPAERLRHTERFGRAGEKHRESIYAGRGADQPVLVEPSRVLELLASARRWTSATLVANEREDGLFHSYNLLRRVDGGIELRRLELMLEGQVAILGAGLLDHHKALALLKALRASSLYRVDQHSYLLYPDREQTPLLSRGVVTQEQIENSTGLTRLAESGGGGVLVTAADGSVRFAADLHYRPDLAKALREAPIELSESESKEVLATYEAAFDHEAFPGRSMNFFGYEGLGCVYWHMVSKLVLAAQQMVWDAPEELRDELARAYEDVRSGLGTHKDPEVYGAFPTDPYSHTPGGGGARQPGLTGQVKEDVLGRLAECGVHVENGCLNFRGELLHLMTPVASDVEFDHFNIRGEIEIVTVPEGSSALTYCSIPVVVHRGDERRIRLELADGQQKTIEGAGLDEELSRAVFMRTGEIRRMDVWA